MQALSTLWQLSWRNMWRNTRRNLILGCAIAIGVATILVAAALLRGWQTDLRQDAIVGAGGSLKVMRAGYREDPQARFAFTLPPALAESLDASRVPWTQRIMLPAVVHSERATRGVLLQGVDPAYEARFGVLQGARISGSAGSAAVGSVLRDAAAPHILLGRELARRLKTQPGRRIVLTLSDASGRSREVGVQVSGLYDVDGNAREVATAFVHLQFLQHLIAPDARVTEVALFLQDGANAARWQSDLRQQLPQFEVLDWRTLQPQTAAMLELVGFAFWIWFGLLFSALSFGVANTLIMAVLERARELGLLFVLGMQRRQIMQQVLIESMLVVSLGLLLGLGFAALWLWWIAGGVDLSRWAAGLQLAGMHARMYPELQARDIGLTCALVLLLGFLGALYPAWRAIRLDPLEALHGRKT